MNSIIYQITVLNNRKIYISQAKCLREKSVKLKHDSPTLWPQFRYDSDSRYNKKHVPYVIDQSHKPFLEIPISLCSSFLQHTHTHTLLKIYSKNRPHNPDMLYNCMSFQVCTKMIEFTMQNPCLLSLGSLPSTVSHSFCSQASVWFIAKDHTGRERMREIGVKTT